MQNFDLERFEAAALYILLSFFFILVLGVALLVLDVFAIGAILLASGLAGCLFAVGLFCVLG